jgi:endonuclease YncB( thermonuclease family)
MITLALAVYLSSTYAIDGDTIRINKEWVRLAQVNTPERGECQAWEATEFTRKFLENTGQIKLISDWRLDSVDKYGRSIRYLMKGNKNLNLELVKNGYAKPYFFNNARGRYAKQIEKYARQAKASRLGLWNCKIGEK